MNRPITTYDNRNKFLIRFEFFVYISVKNFANRKHAQHSAWTWTMSWCFVTVQGRAYGEAVHIPGAHEKDRRLWCEIETHFKVSVYHNWPPHVNMFRGGALKINPNKVYIFWKLNKWRIRSRFFFFRKQKSFLNFAQRNDIYPFFFFKFVYSRDYRRNMFNIANDSLHIAFQKGVSDPQRSLRFLFIPP